MLMMIVVIALMSDYIPLPVQQLLYSISCSIKSFIIFSLPFIIFGLLFKATVQLTKNATHILIFLLLGVCCSNFLTTTLSRFFGEWVYSFDLSLTLPEQTAGLQAPWAIAFPSLVKNYHAMIAAIVAGLLGAKFFASPIKSFASYLDFFVQKLLKLITYLIPFFVAGFCVKLKADGAIHTIIKDYTIIFAIIAIAQVLYVITLYWISNRFQPINTVKHLLDMLPAAISGFSTMSSAASMPLTIIGTERHLKNKNLAGTIIPATVNIHLIGDCIAIPCFAYAVLKNYGVPVPDFTTYVVFSIYFVIAKFSVAAIPGGGILVMLPILEKYLHFTPDMISLITALYLLFDPIITSMNVLGNGAFAKIVDGFLQQPRPTNANS